MAKQKTLKLSMSDLMLVRPNGRTFWILWHPKGGQYMVTQFVMLLLRPLYLLMLVHANRTEQKQASL